MLLAFKFTKCSDVTYNYSIQRANASASPAPTKPSLTDSPKVHKTTPKNAELVASGASGC